MIEKEKIDLELLLPSLPDARDCCVKRLRELLESRQGIDATHLVEVEAGKAQQVCIHFDTDQISLSDVRALAKQAGLDLHQRYGHLLLSMPPMHARRARTLTELAGQIPGVLEAVVAPDGLLRLEFDRQIAEEPAIRHGLREAGIVLEPDDEPTSKGGKPCSHEHKHTCDHTHAHGWLGEQSELIFALLCGLCLGIGWSLAWIPTIPTAVSLALYVAAYFFGGYYTLQEAIASIRAGRFEIDFLMLVAAAGAAALGTWAEGALLLFLFSLGHALEHFAMGRAKQAISALADLAPKTARVRRGAEVQEVPVEQLQRGDVVIVRPNERVSADGFVLRGESSIDQLPITGESVPVQKIPVDDPQAAAADPSSLEPAQRVFAGSINQNGALEIEVTRRATESTLARVVALVSEAETQQSPTQRFTDRFERYFVPAILGFVVLLLFAGVVVNEPFSASFYRAMAVLVSASPCALAIATPSAVLSGIARAARGGVLVKGGGPLEHLGTLGAIAFDKTGTLTEGKPQLTDVVTAEGVSPEELLQIALAVEEHSDHPLAAAVVRGSRERMQASKDHPASDLNGTSRPTARDLKSITGLGVQAFVGEQQAVIGNEKIFSRVSGPEIPAALRAETSRLENAGRTTMLVRWGDRYLGVLGLIDKPRATAAPMLVQLRRLGIKRLVMISGDNQSVAQEIAREVGIDEAFGGLLPDGKVATIKQLREHQAVAMVGDGVNDAPAMANATVGIAMGAAGSDVALETASVALMADDLNQLPFAVGLSRQTSRVIRQNLWFSLGMVSLLVPATVFGLQMGYAVLLHEGSTLLVVVNALRLLAYRQRD